MKKIKLFAMAVAALLCGNAMAATSVPDGTYALTKTYKPSGNGKFCKVSDDALFTYRDNNSSWEDYGLKIKIDNKNAIIFYVDGNTDVTFNDSVKSSKETDIIFDIYTFSATAFATMAKDNVATGTITISETDTAFLYSETVQTAATPQMIRHTITFDAGYYYVVAHEKVDKGSNYLNSLVFAAAGEKYTAHFESEHGTAPADTSVASIKLPELEAEGFLHLGWTADQKVKVGEDSIAPGELLANDVKVGLGQATNFTAVWTAAFTVSYYNGENLLGSEKVISGEKPVEYAQYESKAHMTFVGWFDEIGLIEVHPADSVITSDADFYGQWSGEVAQSASINIEQLVLDNGKGYNIKDALTAANIGYADIDALDSLNDAKDARNEPYLGLKIKKQGGYIEMGLKEGDVLRVKFGYIKDDLTITINNVDSTLAVADAKVGFEYTATEDCWVKIATTTASTVVLKQIMMNEDIKDVVLPVSPTTALRDAMMNGKAQKFMMNNRLYIRHNGMIFDIMGHMMAK